MGLEGIIAAVLAALGIGAGGVKGHQVYKERQLDPEDSKLAKLESDNIHQDARLDRIDDKLDKVIYEMSHNGGKSWRDELHEQMRSGFEAINQRMDDWIQGSNRMFDAHEKRIDDVKDRIK